MLRSSRRSCTLKEAVLHEEAAMGAIYRVALVRERGIDLVLPIVGAVFASLPADQQATGAARLQLCAAEAGLVGVVIPVWDAGGGRLGFWAPPQWHGHLSGLTWPLVLRAVGRTLNCG
jgi:hypothetical protein